MCIELLANLDLWVLGVQSLVEPQVPRPSRVFEYVRVLTTKCTHVYVYMSVRLSVYATKCICYVAYSTVIGRGRRMWHCKHEHN